MFAGKNAAVLEEGTDVRFVKSNHDAVLDAILCEKLEYVQP